MHSTVKQMSFSSLYLGHPLLGDRFSDVPGAEVNPLPASALMQEDLARLHAVCKNMQAQVPLMTDFKISYDGITYLVSAMQTSSGEVFVLRKIADNIESLAELGIPRAYIRQLMTKDLPGVFIISGPAKAGKTMTACSLIKERLAAFGGIAVTAEDPIELPLEGSYGTGICYQTTIHRESGGAVKAFQHIVRWGAKMILVGEISDPEIAVEILQAGLKGHLIIGTMHAENVIETISKLRTLVNRKLAPGVAQLLVADGLVGVMHQHLTGGQKKKLETEFLFLKDAALARKTLRSGQYEILVENIRLQMAAMIEENAVAQRQSGA